jgi:hypothetical protein
MVASVGDFDAERGFVRLSRSQAARPLGSIDGDDGAIPAPSPASHGKRQ